jgi:hypothetical protein
MELWFNTLSYRDRGKLKMHRSRWGRHGGTIALGLRHGKTARREQEAEARARRAISPTRTHTQRGAPFRLKFWSADKLRGLSMSGTARRVVDKGRAQELSLLLFRALPQTRRYVPEDRKRLAVYEILPVAISLIDYSSGFGKSHLVEL